MTSIIAAVGDLHANSTIGLCPPRFTLDDGGEYRASKAQRWLWDNWLDYVGKVAYTAGRHDGRIITILNGDLFDGDHHGTYQIVTRNEQDQLRLTYEVIKPLVEISEQVYIIRGTASHTGQSGWMEEAIADDIGAIRDTDTASWWHLPLSVDGVLFDIAHHGVLGYRPWTRANAVNRLASETIIYYASRKRRIPDVVLRGHRHVYADSGSNYVTRAIQMPAWQLATGYVYRINPGRVADVGGLIFTIDKGAYALEVCHYRPTVRQAVRA